MKTGTHELLSQFAAKHKFRVQHSREDDTDNIVGKHGEIYEYGSGKLAIIVIQPRYKPPRIGRWVRFAEKFRAAGMAIVQNGDQEGVAIFDPVNPVQVKLASQAIKPKRIRNVSPETQARLRTFAYKALRPAQEGHLAP